MNIVTYVGGREVVAAGTLVLAGGDVVASVFIEDITYHFLLAHALTPPTLGRSNPTPKSLQLTIAGSYHTPCQWLLNNVGTINRRNISLAFDVTWFAALHDRPASAKVSYTFTAGPESVAGLLL